MPVVGYVLTLANYAPPIIAQTSRDLGYVLAHAPYTSRDHLCDEGSRLGTYAGHDTRAPRDRVGAGYK
jgi:hypothetical protein